MTNTSTAPLGAIGEHDLIARIRARVGAPGAGIALGIGDDAAIIEPPRGTRIVVTTDALVEDVHFRRRFMTPSAVGYKALAINLSDLAAMGAPPLASFLSLALPADFSIDDFDALIDGVVTLAEQTGAPLAGGNLSRSPGPLVVDVTAMGAVRPRRVLTRAGGRPGDELYVTGSLGAAAAGLALLDKGLAAEVESDLAECVERFTRPQARGRIGVTVARRRAASAAMDLSDGLADAVRQLAGASGTGAVVEASSLPVHAGARTWCGLAGRDPIELAISGGEDYELLFAVPRRQRRNFLAAVRQAGAVPATCIGRLERAPDISLDRAGRTEPLRGGFVHF